MSDADERAARRAQRADWPGEKVALAQDDGGENLSGSTTAEERLAMMWELALSAWSLSQAPLPSYTRAESPGRVLRPGST